MTSANTQNKRRVHGSAGTGGPERTRRVARPHSTLCWRISIGPCRLAPASKASWNIRAFPEIKWTCGPRRDMPSRSHSAVRNADDAASRIPSELEDHIRLPNQRLLHVPPLRPCDDGLIRELYSRLSPRTRPRCPSFAGKRFLENVRRQERGSGG